MKKLLLLAALIIILPCLYIVFNGNKLIEKYRPEMERVASKAVGTDVKLDNLALGLFPPTIKAKGFALENAPARLAVSEVALRLKLAGLLSGNLQISELLIAKPDIQLGIKEKQFVLPIKKKAAPTDKIKASDKGAKAPLSIGIETLKITDGSFKFFNESRTFEIAALGLKAPVTVDANGLALSNGDFTGKIKSGGETTGKLVFKDNTITGNAKITQLAVGSALAGLAPFPFPKKEGTISVETPFIINKDGLLLDKLLFNGFGGNGNALVNFTFATKKFSASGVSKGLALADLLASFKPGLEEKLTGVVTDATYNISGIAGAVPRTLDGELRITLSNILLQGFNFLEQVLNGAKELGGAIQNQQIGGNSTALTSATANIKLNGVGLANIVDLTATSELFTLTGSGTFAFGPTGAHTVNLSLSITLSPAITTSLAGKVRELQHFAASGQQLIIPVKIQGTLPNILILPDLSKLLTGAIKDTLRSELKKRGLGSLLDF